MKQIRIVIALMCLFLLTGCKKEADNTGVNSNPGEENKKQAVDIVIERSENEIAKEDEIMTGEKFYDIGTVEAEDIGDSCFMQPMLQNPTDNGVSVQWFTESEGNDSKLYLYDSKESSEADVEAKVYPATTVKLSRIRGGKSDADKDNPGIKTEIYKHIAVVDDLPEYHGLISERRYYKVCTDEMSSKVYSLSAKPQEGTPLRILLTSDHQIKDMVACNIQKVFETVGKVDAVFVNGDIVDVSDRAYDWFYADNAFFRCMSGTASDDVNGRRYKGAPILQEAAVYTAIGNHDVMGVYDEVTPLSTQFNEPRPRWQAEEKSETVDFEDELSRERFVEDNSYNTITTEEIFENPSSTAGGEKYYGVTFGDIRLIALDISRVWRLPNIGLGGKYSEVPGLARKDFSGGDFIFESIKEGSRQVNFLDEELSKDEYKNAKIKMVMFHSEAHSLGGNQIPAFTDPVAKEVTSPITGQQMTIYDYPIDKDYISNVIEPRLVKAGTNILFEAHSHLWNRFVTESGMNVIETSNVGNSYGGYDDDNVRKQLPTAFDESDQYHKLAGEWDTNNYKTGGDPYGLEAVMPNICSLPDDKPYLDSNTITAFSILDTYKGTVDSYYFDTENPDSEVVLFDSFKIVRE